MNVSLVSWLCSIGPLPGSARQYPRLKPSEILIAAEQCECYRRPKGDCFPFAFRRLKPDDIVQDADATLHLAVASPPSDPFRSLKKANALQHVRARHPVLGIHGCSILVFKFQVLSIQRSERSTRIRLDTTRFRRILVDLPKLRLPVAGTTLGFFCVVPAQANDVREHRRHVVGTARLFPAGEGGRLICHGVNRHRVVTESASCSRMGMTL